jgi:hypothetical protein
MMIAMMVAGVGAVLAGLLATWYGIGIRGFELGNLLIETGVFGVCSGMIMLGLSAVVAELKVIARRLTETRIPSETRPRPALPSTLPEPQPDVSADAVPPLAPPIRQEDIPPRGAPPPEVEPAEPASPAPPPRPKRNLLFSSSVRKDRERAPGTEPAEPPPADFEDAWPKIDRGRAGDIPPQRRSARPPAGAPEANGVPAPERNAPPPSPPGETQAGVTVLKSGVVDGMAYSLYSDGSIEAQMPEGLMRFASLDELTAHIDRRP